DATAAAEQVILGRKSPFGERVRVPWNLVDTLFSHDRAVCEGYCRYHNMTGWLNGGRGVHLGVQPSARQIRGAASHQDGNNENEDAVSAHFLISSLSPSQTVGSRTNLLIDAPPDNHTKKDSKQSMAPLLRSVGATPSHHWRAGVKILSRHCCCCIRNLNIAETQQISEKE